MTSPIDGAVVVSSLVLGYVVCVLGLTFVLYLISTFRK
jgi:hypothetical protein